MRKLFLLVSAAAMAASMPALAKPGKGGGNAGAKAQTSVKAKAGPVRAKSTVRARTDARANTRARTRTGAAIDRTRDIDRDGIPDYRDRNVSRTIDADGDGIPDYRDRNIARTRDASCPPGLDRKDNGCLPPGQAKKMFAEGQRIPDGYNFYTDYTAIPERYRDDIPEMYRTGDYRYIYRDRTVYVVDPATRLVRGIFNLID